MRHLLKEFFLGIMCIFAVLSCEKATEVIPVTSVSLNKQNLELVAGETAQLTATVKPADATEKAVTWSTSDASIATVENGKVTAVKEGEATITAKAGDKSATCKVVIAKKVIAVESVELNKTSLELVEEESETLTATVKPADATEKAVTWSTSDASIATVENGKVTAVKEGEATITAKAGDKSATCKVVIAKKVIAVESVELNKTSLELVEEESETLTATVKPDNATEKAVTWSTSDASIATVENGKVNAVKEGEATITAKAGNKAATCKVVVAKKVIAIESVELNKTSIELVEGESETLTATVKPDNATDRTVTWVTSDASIATVENGKITAVKEGEASVTAKAGEKQAACSIFVKRNTLYDIIVFADAKVKEKLVAVFDTNSDGELSYGEAASVINGDDVKAAFGAIKTYKSFDEFQFFTGLTSIPNNMFDGWVITSVIIPKNIKTIGKYAFRDCSSLSALTIPDGVSHIESYAFQNCNRLAEVIIPESIKAIGRYAFSGCSSLLSLDISKNTISSIEDGLFSDCVSLSSITLPNGVTTIKGKAFSKCTSLTSITIPDNVNSIGARAFENCKSLSAVSIPNTVTSVGSYAFSGCTSLVSVVISNNISSIESNSFAECRSLLSVTIPESVSTIGESAFAKCYSLNSVIIPESVSSIGEKAFADCTSLTSITIPGSVKTIGTDAFANCSRLSSIIVPEGLTRIWDCAFTRCTGLTSFVIPDGVTEIGNSAFVGCVNLVSVSIPNSVSSIGDYAFSGCSNLPAIDIPKSVTTIGQMAFNECSNLTSIDIPETVTTIKYGTFMFCYELTSVKIPKGVTTIKSFAFYHCNKLSDIIIPESVISIEQYAFYAKCSEKVYISVYPLVPPSGGANMFVDTDCVIYVPSMSVDAYKAAEYWSTYASRIQAMP